MLSKDHLHQLCHLAMDAATTAGRHIKARKNTTLTVELKANQTSLAAQVVSEVDVESQAIILDLLKPSFKNFQLGLLTEELKDDHSRLHKDYFWCIDPLDGTLPFTEGTDGYAVSIALVNKAGQALIGVVCNPETGDLYHAIKGGGAYKNMKPWLLNTIPSSSPLTLISDRSFVNHPNYTAVMQKIQNHAEVQGLSGMNSITHGGAVMNAIWVIETSPACYIKLPKPQRGGGNSWDFAATACIFNELGLVATDIKGEALHFNKPHTTQFNHEGVIYSSFVWLSGGEW